jgi:hypothetical protein
MTRHAVWSRGIFVLLAAASISGCHALAMCGPPGQTQACVCSNAKHGAQVCLPERVWDKCDCTGSTKVAEAATDAAVKMDAAPAMSSPSMSSPKMSSPVAAQADSGVPAPDAHVAADSGPAAATRDSGASDASSADAQVDAAKPSGAAYKACSTDGDCMPMGTCATTPDPLTLGMVSVCQPACTASADCPKPGGTFEASVTCDATNHVCQLDCAPSALLSPTLSCPSGMTCVVNLSGAFLCYAN